MRVLAGHDLVPLQRVAIHGPERGRGPPVAARDHQRRFGESITRIERFAAEAERAENADERVEGHRRDRLRPDIGHLPRAEVEPLAVFRRDRTGKGRTRNSARR